MQGFYARRAEGVHPEAAEVHRSPVKLPSVTQVPTRPSLHRHNQVCRIKRPDYGMLWCVSSSVQNPLFRRRLCPARGRKGGSSTRNWDSASTGSPSTRQCVTINIELRCKTAFFYLFSLFRRPGRTRLSTASVWGGGSLGRGWRR